MDICRSFEQVEKAREAWTALASDTDFFSASQTLDHAMAGWEVAPKAPGTELAIILIWQEEQLVCTWPLYVRRVGNITVASHLGTGNNEEYSGPVIRQGRDATDIARLALSEARKLSDVLEVYAMEPKTPMAVLLDRAGGFKYQNRVSAPIIGLRAHADFDTWFATKSKSFRQGLRYDRKRLSQIGELAFVSVPSGLGAQELVSWLFATKRSYVANRGIASSWVLGPRGEGHFTRLLSRPSPTDPGDADVQGFALKLDGQIIAGCICLRSRTCLELFVTGFDPQHGAYSPGNLLIEDCARWASAHGLDFDFRVSQEAYKLRWVDRIEDRQTVILANSLKGALRPIQYNFRRWRWKTRDRLNAYVDRLRRRPSAT